MGVVGRGDQVLLVPLQEQVRHVPAVPLVGAVGDAVEDLDRVDRPQAENLLRRQEGVVGMNGDDEGTGLEGSGRDPRSRLPFPPRLEVERQVDGADIPLQRRAGNRRVQLGADEGRESVRAEGPRVDDGVAVLLEEVIGDGQEVIAGLPVAAADLFGGARAPSERVEWVWMFPFQNFPGLSKGRRSIPFPFTAAGAGKRRESAPAATRSGAGAAPVR